MQHPALRRRNRFGLTLLVCLATVSLAGSAAAETEPFPEYDAIHGNIGFWLQVFSEWRLDQIVVHDLDYPAVVYDVVDLPGPKEERYTEEQQEFIDELNELWRDRMLTLEAKVGSGAPLNGYEKGWALALADQGGGSAVVGASERVRTQRGLLERFRRGVEISGRYIATLRAIFRKAGLPEDLAFLPHVESSFQAQARSSAGAVGVWQFTRGTGRRYLTISTAVDERLDPIVAARGAARYLSDAYDRLGSWPIALTAYNHGVQGMYRAVERFGADYERIYREYDGRLFGFASKNFYSEFLAARIIAREPGRFFPEGLTVEPALRLDSHVLGTPSKAKDIAGVFDIAIEELARLNPAWSDRVVREGRRLPTGIEVWLPQGTLDRAERAGMRPREALATTTEQVHVVRRGDSLSTIAVSHGMSTATLRRMNGIPASSSLIHTGQELRVEVAGPTSVHVVLRGENLSLIAQRYGMELGELRRLNGIAPRSSLIRPGMRLQVLDHKPGGAVHVVRRGESLSRIASRYGVTLSSVLQINRLQLGSVIHPGQTIRIPG